MRETAYRYEFKEEKVSRLELPVRRYFQRHPFWGLLIMSVGVPVASIAAIFISTAAVILPLSCMMGWNLVS